MSFKDDTIDDGAFSIKKVDVCFLDLIDHLLGHRQPINKENSYQLAEDSVQPFPFSPSVEADKPLKMAGAVIFQSPSQQDNQPSDRVKLNSRGEWLADLDKGSQLRGVYQQRKTKLATVDMPLHNFHRSPFSYAEMEALAESCTFSPNFEWGVNFLSGYGLFPSIHQRRPFQDENKTISQKILPRL